MSEQSSTKTSDMNGMVLSDSPWPSGWYIYENGQIEGPLSADAAFGRQGDTSDGKPRLVSRKGFTQWYSMKDLSEIFQMTDSWHKRVASLMSTQEASQDQDPAAAKSADKLSSQSEMVGAALAFSPAPSLAARAPGSTQTSKVKGKVLGVKKDRHAPLSKINKRALTSETVPVSDLQNQPSPALAVTGEQSQNHPQANVSKPKAPTPLSTKAADYELMHEYFLLRGRLRLGKLRSTWMAGWVGVPLTLGLYWFKWFRDVAHDVTFHIENKHELRMPPIFCAAIPLLHLYMVYRLAGLVVQMEQQNGYRKISPPLAAVLAVLPPLALIYLQGAVNRHWLLHVKHSLEHKGKSQVPVPMVS